MLDDLRALVELPRPGPSPRAVETEEATTPSTIQHTMWNYVGIVRTYERLKRAVADMRELGNRLTKFYHEATISKAIVELFHGQQCAGIVASAALRNPVSRGAHFRRD